MSTGAVATLPRVLTLTNMYPSEQRPAFGVFVKRQVESLRALGLETDVMFVDGRATRRNYAVAPGRIRRRLASRSYGLIHAHYGLTGWLGRVQWRRPLVVTFHGTDLLGGPASSPMKRALVNGLAWINHGMELAATALIVQSERMRESFWVPGTRRKAHVIPCGVNLDLFSPMEKARARQRLGWRASKQVVLFPQDPKRAVKRFDLAVAAIGQLKRTHPAAELVAVQGVDPELMPIYYGAADVVLLTSDSEGSPSVVKEALACQRPVVSVGVGDVPERLRDLSSCRIAERDPGLIARDLEQVLDADTHDARELRRAVKHLGEDRIARRVLEVYRLALG